jgi:nucleoid DNA-binding protein
MPKTGTLTEARIVEIMLELVKRSLETGEHVLISDFGK